MEVGSISPIPSTQRAFGASALPTSGHLWRRGNSSDEGLPQMENSWHSENPLTGGKYPRLSEPQCARRSLEFQLKGWSPLFTGDLGPRSKEDRSLRKAPTKRLAAGERPWATESLMC